MNSPRRPLQGEMVGYTARRPSIADVFHSDLYPSARLVYAAMCFYGVNTGRCWVAIPILAQHCGLSVNGVRKALQELEGAGFIVCLRASKGGRRKMPDGTLQGVGSEYVLNPTGRTRKEPSTEWSVRTPHSVEDKNTEPSTQFLETPHSVCENPPLSGDKRRIEEEYKKTTPSPPLDQREQSKSDGASDGEVVSIPCEVDATEQPVFDVWQERISCLLTDRHQWPSGVPPVAKINGELRRQIKVEVVRQGFSVAHMDHAFDFTELTGWRNWRIGLLRAASEFRTRYGHETFPACLHCRDTGIVASSNEEPCPHCPRGQEVAEQRQRRTEELERQMRELANIKFSAVCRPGNNDGDVGQSRFNKSSDM
jgi:hypothetical protein